MSLLTKKLPSPLNKMDPAELGELFKKTEQAMIDAVGGEETFEAMWEYTRKNDLKAARKKYFKIALFSYAYGYLAHWILTRPEIDAKIQANAQKLVAKLLKRS